MEPNGLGGGMFSSISSGLLGVENPLQQQQQQQQNLSNPQNPHHMHHSQMVSYASSHHETDIPQAPTQQSIKHGYPSYSAKVNQQMALSDDDEAGFGAEDNVSSGDKRKVSQWHRMKWTDTMVRLLIMAVYYIGDNEGGSEGADKKKPAGLLQKKGKWKSVSRAMMEKGFFVSPQQCEDKFNDLNKRYKRVNDILGKGTSCLVVENHSLLDTMDLSPKSKDEVRKLLNSKHLFFREMCAYHNSCGHGGGGGATATCGPPQQQSPEVGTEPSQAPPQPQQQHQRCSHSSQVGMANLGKPESEGLKIPKEVSREEDEDNDEDDESEDSSDEDEEESGEGVSGGHKTGNAHELDEDENYEGRPSTKRSRKEEIWWSSSKVMQETSNEVMGVLQDGGRSAWEKRQWMKRKVIQLEEQQLRYEVEAFELEKQRLKWARFSSKKERDMERAKLENQRRQLENEKMVLLLRQKDLELLSQSSPSPTTAAATFF